MSLKGKTIHSKERMIVNNVTEFFEKEANAQKLLLPLNQAQKRASAATGVSLRTIKRIKREALASPGHLSTPGKHRKRPAERNAVLDNFDLCVIRNIVNEFYVSKRIPSLRTLLPVIKERITFPWKKETLRKFLLRIGFRWKRCIDQRKTLIERADIVAWRCRFLREMKKFRESKREIVYLDETWIDCNLAFSKCWQDEKIGAIVKERAGHRLIVVHAGSKSGFVKNAELIFKAGTATGDYHGQMNYDNFEKWLKEKLIPNIPPHSVICMDNAAYHTKVLNPVPKQYDSKKTMCEWLKERGVQFNESMRKSELFELISENAPKSKKYCIDELLKCHGHDVIRLPPYHCDMNPIELAWASIKRYVRERNANSELNLKTLTNLTIEAIKNVSSKEWENYCSHVENIEKKYWETDGVVEETIENFSFIVSSDSETDTASELDSDYNNSSDSELSGIHELK